MKQKWFVLIVVALIIAVLGIIGFFVYKRDTTSKPQADWETYINKDYGYSFKYPADFVLSENPSLNIMSASSSNSSNYSIFVESGLNISDFEPWMGRIQEDVDSNGLSAKIELIDNKKAYFQSRMSAEGIFERNVFIVLDKSIIWVSVQADTSVKGNEEPAIYSKIERLVDSILSTFEFVQ